MLQASFGFVLSAYIIPERKKTLSILYILLVLLVAGIILWAVKTLLAAPGITVAEPFKTVIWVVVVVLLCFFVIQTFFGVVPGVPHLRL
jgi:hypothetical protein